MAKFADAGRRLPQPFKRSSILLPRSWCAVLLSLVLVLFLETRGRSIVVAAAAATAGAAGGSGKAKAGSGLGAPASDIITVTSQNFKETIKEGTWFVKFYTDWCKHCQRLQPTWEELATELKGKVNVGQVNCDRDYSLCRRFHVAGYPTLVHVHNRRTRVYKKSRGKEALVAFALNGYKKQVAVSALKSPFGPLENFKALVAREALRAKKFVVSTIEKGTPMWMVCLCAVAVLVVVTVVVATVLVSVKRPKED
ncbi:unnamed protein product [Ectocarpus sp. 12 AP-2014]